MCAWVSNECPQSGPQSAHAGEGVRPHLNSNVLPGYIQASGCSICLLAVLVLIRIITSPRVLLPWLGRCSHNVVRGT